MLNTIALVVLALAPGWARQDSELVVPKGIWTVPGFVAAVHEDTLEFKGEPGVIDDRGKHIRLKVTKDTRIEQADVEMIEGKPALKIKSITLKDLHPDQPIGVTIYSDGKELILVQAVATGPKLSGKDLGPYVGRLGGKVTRLTWVKDKVAYDVDLRGTRVSDDDLLELGLMKGVYSLDLSFTGVTDKGVGYLAGSADLSDLNLAGTKVTDASVPALRQSRLSSLNIAQTGVTDKGLAQLVKDRRWSDLCYVGLGPKAQFSVHHHGLGADGADYNLLMIGGTNYGMYIARKLALLQGGLPVDRRREAITYYHRDGPVGQVMAKLEWFKPAGVLDYPSDIHAPAALVALLPPPPVAAVSVPTSALVGLWSEPAFGVVRLNVGTQAAYGRPLQHVDFYNSTLEIKTFSLPPPGQPSYFGYVKDALARGCLVRVIDGDERTMLGKKGPKQFYSALFVEITRNDLRDINTQLLTKEALAEFMGALTETGVVCFHISHRYHNMVPPLVDAAKSLNLAWKVGKDSGTHNPGDYPSTHFSSEWVVIARKAEYLAHLSDVKTSKQQLTWTVLASTGQHLWRDGQPHDLKPLERPPLK
jgi:hypothetical protein